MAIEPVGEAGPYAARLEIDYAPGHGRLSTLLRVFYIIPIFIVYAVLTGGFGSAAADGAENAGDGGGGVLAGLIVATALMLVFRRRYPRWWFDFARELTRFGLRVSAYAALLTDEYPSTVEEQRVRLELDYPDAERDLNRWLPLVKWLLAIPHFIVLIVLAIGAVLATVVAWFAILITGRYPRGLFDYVVGVFRWGMRVQAYAFLMLTDRYPPFRLGP
ncbi:MAG: DUF4389 domain-containing protein [Dehalococcoidia bacterium]